MAALTSSAYDRRCSRPPSARGRAKRGGGRDGARALRGIRSLLFLPASNPRAIDRARKAGADLVVLDLEDAVKPEAKAAARQAAPRGGHRRPAAREPTGWFWASKTL